MALNGLAITLFRVEGVPEVRGHRTLLVTTWVKVCERMCTHTFRPGASVTFLSVTRGTTKGELIFSQVRVQSTVAGVLGLRRKQMCECSHSPVFILGHLNAVSLHRVD